MTTKLQWTLRFILVLAFLLTSLPSARADTTVVTSDATIVVTSDSRIPLPIATIFGVPTEPFSPVGLYHQVWQVVKEKYFDTAKLEKLQWNSLEHAYDEQIKTEADAEAAIKTLLAKLGDRYTRFLGRRSAAEQDTQLEGKFGGIGASFGYAYSKEGQWIKNAKDEHMPFADENGYPVVATVYLNTPAEKAGILPGDAVVSIDGRTSKGLSFDDFVDSVKGDPKTQVKLEILRNGKSMTLTITREEIEIPNVVVRKLPNNIGYIRIVSFMGGKTRSQLLDALWDLKDADSLIIDLRDNPGGLMLPTINMAAFCLDANQKIMIWRYRNGNQIVRQDYDRALGYPNFSNEGKRKPMALLVNEGSASASEIFAGALVDNGRAVLVGTRTYGKGLVQIVQHLPGGYACDITIAGWNTPKDYSVGNGDGKNSALAPTPERTVTLNKGQYIDLVNDVVGKDSEVDLKNDPQLLRATEVVQAMKSNSNDAAAK
jgi:carboxyl-terminal processing protease